MCSLENILAFMVERVIQGFARFSCTGAFQEGCCMPFEVSTLISFVKASYVVIFPLFK